MIDFTTFNSPDLIRIFRETGYWPGKTLNESFEEAVRAFPEKKALIQGDKVVTYREFKEATDRLAAGLKQIGISRGTVVSVQLPNCIEFSYLQIALAKIGAIFQPIHMPFRRYEVESQLRFCESAAVVIMPEHAGFNYMEMIQGIKPELPQLRYVLTVGGSITGKDIYAIEELCKTESADLGAEEVQQDADHIILLNFTSGTEGDPKGFLHTHNTIIAGSARLAKVLGYNENDVFLSFSPMPHTFGHIITYFSVLACGTLVFVEKYNPEETLRLIKEEKISYIQGTPAHLFGMLDHPNYRPDDLKSLRLCFTGGAQVPSKLIKQLRDEIGCDVVNAYGQGENLVHTMASTLWDTPEKMLTTVGRGTMIGAEVKIVDETREKEVPQGEVGEICFRGPSLFIGYFKNPNLTAKTRNQEGWFFTGDAGYLDQEGYLNLVGRKKEMINRGGTKIYPLETENLLHFHPKILRAAVVGMPDARLGERVCVYIVCKEGETITQEEVVEYLTQKEVSLYKIPQRVEVIPEMPLVPTGKINKLQLCKDIVNKLIQEGKWQPQ